eukprot:15481225-Alexandrium_andersonii.AAC.1
MDRAGVTSNGGWGLQHLPSSKRSEPDAWDLREPRLAGPTCIGAGRLLAKDRSPSSSPDGEAGRIHPARLQDPSDVAHSPLAAAAVLAVGHQAPQVGSRPREHPEALKEASQGK